MTVRKLCYLFFLLGTVLAAGCTTPPPADTDPAATMQEIQGLTDGIIALGDGVDPEEAARAAQIAIEYSRQLAVEYNVTDPPLIHNMKVNNGIRPRGLCYQWADDIEARLSAENFKTLGLHRAIANAENPFLIDHSTTIISRRGDTMVQGMILDPWRFGGTLFWSPVPEDARYDWVPRAEVFARKRQTRTARLQTGTGS